MVEISSEADVGSFFTNQSVASTSNLAHIRRLMVDAETGRASDDQLRARVFTKKARIGVDQLQYSLFPVKTANKKDRARLTQTFLRMKQVRIHAVEHNLGFGGKNGGAGDEPIAQVVAAHDHKVKLRRKRIQGRTGPMTQVIVLQMQNNPATIAQSSQESDPLRPIVDMSHIAPSQLSDQRPQP